MFKTMFVAVTLFSASLASAQMYKCTINGSLTFSDKPCGADATVIEVKTQKAGSDTPDPGIAAMADELSKDRRRAELDKEIKAAEDQLIAIGARMNTELALLRKKKDYANNNLAGATWESSISQEMNAVTEKYRIQSQGVENRLARLRDERAKL